MSGKIFGKRGKEYAPLATTDCTAAVMLLLLLHLLEDGLLLDFNEIPALVLAESQPKLFDALALLCGARRPYLVVFWWLLARRWRSWLVRGGGVGGWGRWMVMGVIMAVGMRGDRRL